VAIATAKEYKAALSGLGAPAPPPPGEIVSWKRGGRDFLVVVTGVGPVAVALSLGRVLGRRAGDVAGVVNCGIAGSFDLTAVPLGGLVVATTETFPEYGLRGDDDTDARAIAFPQLVIGGEPVFDRLPLDPETAAAAMGLTLPADAARGTCVTVAGVTVTPARARTLAGKYEAVAESMEGFAAALAAATAAVPFLELRAVSNRVGSRPPVDWDLPGALSALGRGVARLFS
jgi:futalosine hydrolase